MTEKEDEISALSKLERMLNNNEVVIFTPSEALALQKVAKVFLALETLGGIGGVIKHILVWLGIIIGAWLAFRNGVATWLTDLIQ